MAANNFLDKFKNNIDNSLLSASKLKPGDLKTQTPKSFTFPPAARKHVVKSNAFTVDKIVPPPAVDKKENVSISSQIISKNSVPQEIIEKTSLPMKAQNLVENHLPTKDNSFISESQVGSTIEEKKEINTPPPMPQQIVLEVSKDSKVAPEFVAEQNKDINTTEGEIHAKTEPNVFDPVLNVSPLTSFVEIKSIKEKEVFAHNISNPDSASVKSLDMLISKDIEEEKNSDIKNQMLNSVNDVLETKVIIKEEKIESLAKNTIENTTESSIAPIISVANKTTTPKLVSNTKLFPTVSSKKISTTPVVQTSTQKPKASVVSQTDVEPIFNNSSIEPTAIEAEKKLNGLALVPKNELESITQNKVSAQEEEAFKKWMASVEKTPEEVQAELQKYREAIVREENLAKGLVEVFDLASRTSVYMHSKEYQLRPSNTIEPLKKQSVGPASLLSLISPNEKEVFFAPVSSSIESSKNDTPILNRNKIEKSRVHQTLREEEIELRKKDRQVVGAIGPEDFFLDEIKIPEVLDLFEKENDVEQQKLNEIIKKERRITIFRSMCYMGANHISLTLEAFDKETHIENEFKTKKGRVKITAAHLRKMGFEVNASQDWSDDEEDEDNDFEEDFDPDSLSRLHERNSSMGAISQDFSYLNPIGTKIAQKRQELSMAELKKKREEKIGKYRKTLDIYSDNEASIYQKAIAQFLAENEDILKDNSDHEALPHNREKDEFAEFLEELDDD